MSFNVLSLFDGMSCGQIALNKDGIEYDNYFAAEIKDHAIKVTQHNYPNTIQVGDVTKLTKDNLPKIDLLIGGSPCQDFSQGNKVRKGVEGEKSGLFYEYVRLLRELKPKYFLLENVKMLPEHEAIVTGEMGVKPIKINSQLVSAQLRQRSYWTNIPVGLIEENHVTLQDVLVDGWSDRTKARCLLESDSRPLTTPVKMFHRYYSTGFSTLIFKSEEHYNACKDHYNKNFKGLGGADIHYDGHVYDGLRYLYQEELEQLQTVPAGYTSLVDRNDAACLLGDGWTVDVIAHIFKGINNPNVVDTSIDDFFGF